MPVKLAWALFAAASLGACLLDFEPYDPRITEPVSAAASGGAGTSSVSGGGLSGPTTDSSASAGGATGVGGGGGTGGSGPETITYSPTVAACIYPQMPNPATCAADQPPNTIGVDLSGTSGQEIRSYLRFDLDAQLMGRQVLQVRLELTVSNTTDSDSVASGTVSQVSAFDLGSLSTTVPTNQAQLAGDLGMVALGRTIEWALPNGIAAPNTSIYLGIIPNNVDGVDYNNNLTTLPPRLRVTVQ